MKPLQEYTLEALIHLEPEALHSLARRASRGLVIHRILLGRCLLALQATGRYQDFGCSGPIHYARGLTPARTLALKIRDCYCCQTPTALTIFGSNRTTSASSLWAA
ncbi:MAG: hypothetical protein AB7S38_40285 [Vulcanimicrobiota bacterium]